MMSRRNDEIISVALRLADAHTADSGEQEVYEYVGNLDTSEEMTLFWYTYDGRLISRKI
jgi:hypothetical protein